MTDTTTTRESASRRKTASVGRPTVTKVRCAIYTRKSSDEGLQQEFNSLDAQREAAEAYIASQKAEGWVCIPDRYDDGGFSGGDMERPALKRLMADIDAGKVDSVVVYKVDRLSRSLMDFARMMETFERHRVSFVSVTQHFNTATPMGRLILNVLLSFAQFEREIIGERIRDKIAASRRKGKWTGGKPVLGYDVDRSNGGPRLVINPDEASRVCRIFELYLELGSLLPVVTELERRGWTNKVWTTRAGKRRGGIPFDKCRLYDLLTNVLYVGKVRYHGEVYAGEQEPIVSEAVFTRVQQQLERNGRNGSVEHRNRHGALLRGLLFCKACQRAMSHTFTTSGNRRYRYYACTNAIKRGRRVCPTGSLPAVEIETAVVDQIRGIGLDPAMLGDTLVEARKHVDAEIERFAVERRAIERGLTRLRNEIKRTSSSDLAVHATVAYLAELNQQADVAERRLTEIDSRVTVLQAERIDPADVAAALADFDNVWGALSPREQARVIRLLVQRVEFDATEGTIEVSVHPTGIKTLAGGEPVATEHVEDAA